MAWSWWAVPAPQGESLQVQTTMAAGQANVVVDAVDSEGRYINDATTTATIASPKGDVKTIPLDQVAPGRYAAQVPADDQGAYLVQVSQTVPGQATPVTQTSGFTVPYSPEFGGQATDVGLLRELAAGTGGSVLTSPADSFAHDLRPADSAQPIWPYLIAALIPLFLLDVAIRRLRFSVADLSPVVDRIRLRWLGRSGAAAHLAARLAATRRVSRPTSVPAPRPSTLVARRAPAPVRRASPNPGPAMPGAAPANRLLAAKRRAAPAPHAARR